MSEKFVLDEKAQCFVNSRALSSLSVAVGLCRKARCLPNAWTRAVSRAKTGPPVAPPLGELDANSVSRLRGQFRQIPLLKTRFLF